MDYWDNSDLTAQRLVAYALEHHQIGKEGQTLVVIDECQVIFNCREYGRKDRMSWVQLFAQHRKLGYNFILITQNDRMIDRQIRALVETEIRHRKLNNYGLGGKIFSLVTGASTWFVAIEYWYGGNKLKLGQEMFRYSKKYEKIYDSYRLFADLAGSAGSGVSGGVPRSGGALPTAPGPPEPQAAEKGEEVCNSTGVALGDAAAVS